jgi:integrase
MGSQVPPFPRPYGPDWCLWWVLRCFVASKGPGWSSVHVPVTSWGWLSSELLAGRCVCWGVARKRREHVRPESGVPIPLPADVVTRLREHPVPLLPDGWLFPTSTGNTMSDSNWRKRTWRRIKDLAGVECRPHDLRHTVATRLFMVARWTPGEVQRYMGHLDPRVTLAIYTHITTEDLPAPPAMATLVADRTG